MHLVFSSIEVGNHQQSSQQACCAMGWDGQNAKMML